MTESSTDKLIQNDENESVAEETEWRTDENNLISLAAIYLGLGIDQKTLLNDNEAISEEIQ